MGGSKQSVIGGSVSFVITAYLTYCIVDRTIQMMTYHSPTTTTKYRGLVDDEEKVAMENTSIPILAILEGGSEDPFKPVNLEENRQFVNVRIRNVIKTYDSSGGETIKEVPY